MKDPVTTASATCHLDTHNHEGPRHHCERHEKVHRRTSEEHPAATPEPTAKVGPGALVLEELACAHAGVTRLAISRRALLGEVVAAIVLGEEVTVTPEGLEAGRPVRLALVLSQGGIVVGPHCCPVSERGEKPVCAADSRIATEQNGRHAHLSSVAPALS